VLLTSNAVIALERDCADGMLDAAEPKANIHVHKAVCALEVSDQLAAADDNIRQAALPHCPAATSPHQGCSQHAFTVDSSCNIVAHILALSLRAVELLNEKVHIAPFWPPMDSEARSPELDPQPLDADENSGDARPPPTADPDGDGAPHIAEQGDQKGPDRALARATGPASPAIEPAPDAPAYGGRRFLLCRGVEAARGRFAVAHVGCIVSGPALISSEPPAWCPSLSYRETEDVIAAGGRLGANGRCALPGHEPCIAKYDRDAGEAYMGDATLLAMAGLEDGPAREAVVVRQLPPHVLAESVAPLLGVFRGGKTFFAFADAGCSVSKTAMHLPLLCSVSSQQLAVEDLLDVLGFTCSEARQLVTEVQRCFAALHQSGWCHGDVALRNICVRINDLKPAPLHDADSTRVRASTPRNAPAAKRSGQHQVGKLLTPPTCPSFSGSASPAKHGVNPRDVTVTPPSTISSRSARSSGSESSSSGGVSRKPIVRLVDLARAKCYSDAELPQHVAEEDMLVEGLLSSLWKELGTAHQRLHPEAQWPSRWEEQL
jgi:hypothetical protein